MELSAVELEAVKYPIGKSPILGSFTLEETKKNIERISVMPVALMKLSSEIKKEDFNYSYRPNGWNVAQILHHLADSHINMYIRVKFALTEENPTIKPYDENLWAVMPDAISGDDAHVSVLIVSGIHHRLSVLLNSLTEEQLNRTVFHPQRNANISIADMCALYAWHGEHHLGQIKVAIEKRF